MFCCCLIIIIIKISDLFYCCSSSWTLTSYVVVVVIHWFSCLSAFVKHVTWLFWLLYMMFTFTWRTTESANERICFEADQIFKDQFCLISCRKHFLKLLENIFRALIFFSLTNYNSKWRAISFFWFMHKATHQKLVISQCLRNISF